MAGIRLVGPVNAIAVDGAGPRGRDVAVPDFVGVFGQVDALDFLLAGIIEEAELDLGGVRREQREIDAEAVPCRPERKRPALADGGAPQGHGRAEQRLVR